MAVEPAGDPVDVHLPHNLQQLIQTSGKHFKIRVFATDSAGGKYPGLDIDSATDHNRS